MKGLRLKNIRERKAEQKKRQKEVHGEIQELDRRLRRVEAIIDVYVSLEGVKREHGPAT